MKRVRGTIGAYSLYVELFQLAKGYPNRTQNDTPIMSPTLRLSLLGRPGGPGHYFISLLPI